MEVPDAVREGLDPGIIGPVIAGMVIAAVSGIIAIKSMIKIVSDKKLSYFSYYVWVLGTITICLGLFSDKF